MRLGKYCWTPLFLALLVGQSLHGTSGYAPRFGRRAKAQATAALRYKSKDLASIAGEIVDLEGDNARRSNSHDHNPWKALLRSKHPPPDDPTKLAGMIRSDRSSSIPDASRTKVVTIESLQHDLFSLFQIAQQLTATELELAGQLVELENERNSIRRLVRRILSLGRERLVRRVRRLLRLEPKTKE